MNMGGANYTTGNEAGRSNFFLKKWYVDAADSLGHVFIGYWLKLRWGKVRLHGSQHLWRTPENRLRSETGLGRLPEPAWQNQRQINWSTDCSTCSWESAADPLFATLLSSEQGTIHWHCCQPKANAHIRLPQINFNGWGYTERLELTIPVWKLPLKTLYWGRCHTEHHALVWIKWVGDAPRTLAWLDGQQSSQVQISQELVQGSNFYLAIDDQVPLHRGRLTTTLLKTMGKAISIFPQSTFISEENKWYGRGRLETPNSTEPATIIYEEVSW